MGVAQNSTRGVTQVLAFVSTYQVSRLVPFFFFLTHSHIHFSKWKDLTPQASGGASSSESAGSQPSSR